MNENRQRSRIGPAMLVALIAGCLQSVPFLVDGFGWLAWFAPGLLLFSALGQTPGRAWFIGFVGGMGFYLCAWYWFLNIPFRFYAIGAWLGMALMFASFTGLWCWFSIRILRARPEVSWRKAAEAFAGTCPGIRILWTLFCAVGWVAMEMLVARYWSGFPWVVLGISQHPHVELIQIASWTAVYGVSFLVAWFSVSLISALVVIWVRRSQWKGAFAGIAVPVAVIVAVVIFGRAQLASSSEARTTIRIGLIQPSIPQTVIWDANERTNRFNKLMELSYLAAREKPQLIVWPEAALPDMLTRFNAATLTAVTNLVISQKIWLVMGANDSRPRANTKDQREFFNSAFLVSPAGDLVSRYHKRRLVPFGEYMPFSRWLAFLQRFRTLDSGFVEGPGPVPFQMEDLRITASALICYEDIFPHLMRNYVADDTDFLLNLTNDGWFGKGAAQWQHAAAAAFRAIENGVPLVRCANTGLTCWIDERGRFHEVNFRGSPDIYGEGYKIAEVPLPAKAKATVYNRYGDWFGWSCVTLVGLALLQTFFRKGNLKSGKK